MIRDLVEKTRSYRRFVQEVSIEPETLRELVDLARLSASGANRQPLKYMLSTSAEKNARIFPHLGWAGYLKDWAGPPEGERPSAYILVLGDTEINKTYGIDPGIALQSILLGATERGLGGCIIASVKKESLRRDMDIPPQFEILYVLALGKPLEQVRIDELGTDGDIKYWRDSEAIHHVPKRSLDDIIVS